MDASLLVAVYSGYAVLKLLGYSLAGRAVRVWYGRPDLSAWRFGLARTLLGIVVGALYTGAWAALENTGLLHGLPHASGRGGSILYYLAGLAPVRVLEWSGMLWYFVDRRFERPGLNAACTALGVVWSFVLDLPAILGAAWVLASIC